MIISKCPFPIPLVKKPNPALVASAVGCRRWIRVITRAGPGPSTASYVFAFVLPLSLLVVTVFTSFRVADKLDQKYLEELAANLAIMDSEEGEEEEKQKEEESSQRRNRPKRKSDSSSSSSSSA